MKLLSEVIGGVLFLEYKNNRGKYYSIAALLITVSLEKQVIVNEILDLSSGMLY